VKNLEKSSSGARKIGAEAIFGDEWTRYRAEPDPDGRGPMRPETVDVWSTTPAASGGSRDLAGPGV
jgi:hypothetical protein